MITCKFYGRLGNILFQMAACIGYSVKHDIYYFFPNQTEDPNRWPRVLANIGNDVEPRNNLIEFTTIRENKNQSFTELPAPDGRHVMLDGYFQNEKYFSHCKEEVIKTFGFAYKKTEGVIGIHVRRGDYLKLPNYHPVVTADYINMAINYFYGLGYRKFKWYSDDIDWCLKYDIKMHPSSCVFFYSIRNTPFEDMESLSCCEHIIGSNSSFSLWGYILNQNPNKIGVFPKTWFGPALAHLDQNAMYPENAIKM